MSAGKLVMFDALNEQYALRADSFGKEFGLNVILKGSGQEYQLLDKISKLNRTIVVPVNFPKPPNVATAEAALDTELEELTHWELAPENPGRLAKAGVKIILTSSGLSDPSELLPQIRKAIARGLDKTTALQAITTLPAALLGIDHECCSIKSGAWANLVVTNGDLWDEKTKIEEVWVRGERPLAAFKVETSIDDRWQVTLSPGGATLESQPSQLFLTLADSTKKISGSLSLPVAQANEEKAEKPIEKSEPIAESKKGDDKKKAEQKGIAKLKNPRWEHRTLTATFPADAEAAAPNGCLTIPRSSELTERLWTGIFWILNYSIRWHRFDWQPSFCP